MELDLLFKAASPTLAFDRSDQPWSRSGRLLLLILIRVKRRQASRAHGSSVVASSSPLSSLMAAVISTSQTSLDFN